MESQYLDDEGDSAYRWQKWRAVKRKVERKYISESVRKLPNELRQYVADDEDFNTRYSYPEDYL